MFEQRRFDLAGLPQPLSSQMDNILLVSTWIGLMIMISQQEPSLKFELRLPETVWKWFEQKTGIFKFKNKNDWAPLSAAEC